jgi:hypothetical protein
MERRAMAFIESQTCRIAWAVVPPAGEEVLGYPILFRGGAAGLLQPVSVRSPEMQATHVWFQ